MAAVNSAAEGAGVVPGLALADARALVPDLHAFPANPDHDARALTRLAAWCGRYTPWTAPEADAGAGEAGAGIWLDVSGCAHLFGGESALLDDLVGRLGGLGFSARAAVAETPGAAWAMARFGMVPGTRTTRIAPGEVRSVLASLPVASLRLAPGVADGLSRLGLRRASDLYDLPRGPLVTRFGESLIRRVDQALGRAPEPVSPQIPPPRYRARFGFAEPIATARAIEAATEKLLATLCAGLERDGRGARQIELSCFRSDGEVARIAAGTSRPVREAGPLLRLLREHFETIDPGFGIDVMVLTAPATDRLADRQLGLSGRGTGPDGENGGADGASLAPLIDRLANRLGADNVVRLVPRQSHLPERAVRAVPLLRGRQAEETPAPSRSPWAGRPRPLSLFHPPQPVEVMAPVPDDPPVLFRWRRRVHRAVRAEGPERLGPEWWREWFGTGEADCAFAPAAGMPESARTRDYYVVEDEGGARFWLYRNGLYRPGAPPSPGAGPHAGQGAPRWYLHGLFG